MSKPKVACIACWNVDLVTRVERLPAPGETVFGDAFATGPGGKGSNVAVGLARLGAGVSIVARLGDDEHGRSALPFWQGEGIDCTHARTAPGEANAVASILVAADGENSIAVYRGAGYRLSAADVQAARAAFEGARVVTLPLELQDEAVGAALALARECGARSVLNPAPARALPDAWLRAVDVLVPNALEARQLFGLPADATATPAALGAQLLQRGVGAVVMTCGRDGAWLFEHGDTPLHVPPFAVDAVDTVGAGDAFNAGLAAALAEGAPLAAAVRLAAAAGALATTRHGAALAMPRRAEVDALLAAHTS
jgi:ribokinase